MTKFDVKKIIIEFERKILINVAVMKRNVFFDLFQENLEYLEDVNTLECNCVKLKLEDFLPLLLSLIICTTITLPYFCMFQLLAYKTTMYENIATFACYCK